VALADPKIVIPNQYVLSLIQTMAEMIYILVLIMLPAGRNVVTFVSKIHNVSTGPTLMSTILGLNLRVAVG